MSTVNQQSNTLENGSVRDVVHDTAESLAVSARDCASECTEHYVTEPARDLISLAKSYAKDKPEVATVWAFTLGVVVGWKIKPW